MIDSTGSLRVFSSGAHRDSNKKKGRFDLIPYGGLKRIAMRYEEGAIIYGERNWEKGIPISVFIDSAIRHMYMYLHSERNEDHLAAAGWNIINAIQTEEWVNENKLPNDLLVGGINT